MLQNVNDCDSVVTMTLDVKSYAQATLNIAICEGKSYNFGGKDLTEAGIYYDTTMRGGSLCDSITELHLTIKDTIVPVISCDDNI